MKKIITIIVLALFVNAANAQFTTATLQASGLTCAMCTRAINKSLDKLSFVASVDADIQNSAFHIVFKPNAGMDIDKLKNAVEDAGFSVARLTLSGNFNNVEVKNDGHVVINGNNFHFLKVKDQVLNGNKSITIVDKNFLTAAAFKQFSAATRLHCVQTGKSDGCCNKDVITTGTRMFHATI